jgi:MFS transporter, DHA3 family, macrolide efflux protein
VPALGVVLGLGLGLLAGGRLENFVGVRLRWLPVLLLAAVGRFALDFGMGNGGIPDTLRLPLVLAIYSLLTAMLLANRAQSGLAAAALGTVANGLAIALNGGWMPIWQPSLAAAGLDPNVLQSGFHTILAGPVDASFLAHGGPLADMIPIPLPFFRSVASVGDLLLAAGLAFFVFSAAVRVPVVSPGADEVEGAAALAPAARRHPYVRLATNSAFSAMWLAQIVSSLGDRVHQVALVFLVARATDNSPLAIGLVFAAMTVPGFLFGPVAGALVDRWDRKHVMVGSDIARAGVVSLIPVASGLHVGLVMALVFTLAVLSSFFRPARAAALPRVVPDEDLLTANSAMWVADTASDLVGYGLGGLFVAFLGSSLALAFWIDAASYLVSAALVAAVVIPPIVAAMAAGTGSAGESRGQEGNAAPATLREDMLVGWNFLRSETVLLATTIQAAVAEYGLGALTALSPLVVASLALGDTDAPTAYGLFEMAMGIGLVGGGVVIGGLAGRMRKGPSIIAAFTWIGLAMIGLAVTGNLWIALLLACGIGLGNVTFVVPSQTLFQQRTPDLMLGVVVSIRLAVVNLVLALAMVTSGALAQALGLRPVLAACGLLTILAGAGGLLVKPIRRA